MADGFGVGEGGGEGRPGRLHEDLLGVGGDGLAYALGVALGSRLRWSAMGEHGQGCGCSLVVGGLQLGEGAAGGFDLLVVVAGGVPALNCHGGEDGGIEKDGDGRSGVDGAS